MEFEPADICEAVKELPKLMCRDTNGRGIGIAVSDVTGETTNNVALIKYSDGRLSIISNVRLPLSLQPQRDGKSHRACSRGQYVELQDYRFSGRILYKSGG